MIDTLVISIFTPKTLVHFGELFLSAVNEGTEVSSSLVVQLLEKLQLSPPTTLLCPLSCISSATQSFTEPVPDAKPGKISFYTPRK